MKAVYIEAFGDNSNIKIVNDAPKPEPKDNEVLIKIKYSGVNPVDWKIREGYLKTMIPHILPIIPGWEASGVIEAVGKDAKRLKVGDEVYAYLRKGEVKEGTYTEYITFPEEHVALKPASLSFAQAAGVPLAGLTAYQSLFDFASLQKDQVALIHAGAGGVGGWAIQLAKDAGATVITTASQKNHEYVKKLGAHVIIDYNTSDFVEEVKKLHPNGVDVVFDTVGGETQQKSWEVVKDNGVLVSIVSPPDKSKGEERKIKNGFVFVSPNAPQLDKFTALFDSNTIIPLHTTERNLDEAATVLAENQARHVRGKVVLKI